MEYCFEICEAIERVYDYELVLYMLRELAERTKISYFRDRLKELCSQKEICSECFHRLEVRTIEENYDGVIQYSFTRKCNNCGHSE